jgi:hypothetical protein
LRSLPTPLLRPGDPFPELTLTVPGGKTVTVPTMFVGQFGVVVFYRGARCRQLGWLRARADRGRDIVATANGSSVSGG